jgi:hypothetical protein
MKTTLLTFIVSLFAFISINAIVPSTLAIEEKKPIELDCCCGIVNIPL